MHLSLHISEKDMHASSRNVLLGNYVYKTRSRISFEPRDTNNFTMIVTTLHVDILSKRLRYSIISLNTVFEKDRHTFHH